jgi:hypothetical protein
MIDFSNAKRFICPSSGQHIEHKKKRLFNGISPFFMSLNAHRGYEQSRKDDLESLGFILVFMLKGDLPWNLKKPEIPHISITDPHAFAMITQQKIDAKKHDQDILKIKR